MAELPPVTIATPAAVSVVTPVVKRRWWGRALDIALIVGAFVSGLLDAMGAIDFAALGITGTRAAWASMFLFAVRYALAQVAIKRVDVKVEPGGQG